jgi:uncharacterized membrane protein YphA (DoxX/SURF4 family)
MSRDRNPAAWVGLGVRVVSAAVWIAAGAAKMPDIRGFRLLVDRYGILPGALAGPFAYALPFAEVGIGLYLVVGLFVRGTALAGTFLLLAFLAAQASAMVRGLSLDCGCFGSLVESTVGPLTLLRDLGLGIPTFLMLAWPARTLSLDRRLFDAPDLFARFPQISR